VCFSVQRICLNCGLDFELNEDIIVAVRDRDRRPWQKRIRRCQQIEMIGSLIKGIIIARGILLTWTDFKLLLSISEKPIAVRRSVSHGVTGI